MEIRFTPAEEDVSNAQRAVPSSRWGAFLFVLLLGLLSLVGAHLIDLGFSVAGWIWLACSFAVGFAAYEVPRIQARRAFRSSPSTQGEFVFTLSDKGILAKFPTGESQLEWRAYMKYKETATLFLLFYSSSRYTLIPKRAMSPEQIKEVRALLNTRIQAQ